MTETTEQKAPVTEQSAPPTPPKKAPGKKRQTKKLIKNVIILVVVATILAVGGFFLYTKVIKEQPQALGDAMTQPVSRGSIQSMVQGSGLTRAKDSATITPTSGGTILELYVQAGEMVEEGQQLYRMDDTEARKAVDDAQKTVTNTNKELQKLYDAVKDLNVNAPHAGKMIKVADLKLGDDVAVGTVVATIVDDTKLKLSLYFSYAYENDIYIGQKAQVSLPATMSSVDGTVETINKVERVAPEGTVLFEAVVVVENPGALTENMSATAVLTAGDGGPIYPYDENAQLKYYQTTDVKTKVAGPVEYLDLLNYAAVKPGQSLVRLGAKDNDEEIATKENALMTAEQKLKDAQETLSNYNAVAPMSGTVISCNLVEGSKVESGQGISIADTTVMIVDISIDERNIKYVKPGMMVQLDQYGTPFMGIVDSVSPSAKAENGVSAFPAVVKVDNPDGSLMTNMYLQYSFVASQSDDCLLVPVQAVQYVSLSGQSGAEGMDPGMMDPGMEGMDPGMEGDMTGEPAPMDTPLPTETTPAETDAPEGGDAATNDGVTVMPMEPGVADAPVADVAVPRVARAVMVGGGSVSIGGGGGMGGKSGGPTTVVFIQGEPDGRPNIVEADSSWQMPEGFFAVTVEIGLADTTNVEIKSGLNEGDPVFIGYANQNPYG